MIDSPTYLEEILPAPSEQKLRYDSLKNYVIQSMAQLHGWCSPEKGAFLFDLILKTKPDTVVEIGVWGGRSFIPMALGLKENRKGIAYGIDPWSNKESTQWVTEEVNKNFWEWANHDLVYNDLNEKIDLFDLRPQVILIKSSSEAAPPIPGIDILHIDGNHSEHTSMVDVEKWVPLVKSGGWIIFDDMKWFENGVFTTAKASAWLDANCHKFAEFTDICTWGVWIKP